MNNYECVLILPGKFSEEQMNNLTNEFKNLFLACGTQEPAIKKIEKKKFSHPIKKQDSGYYLIFQFACHPEALERIKENIRHNEKILRSSFFRC